MSESMRGKKPLEGALEGPEAANESSSHVQLKQALADKPYTEQVQMLRPSLPMGVDLNSPVQASADGAIDTASVHSAAASGLKGPSQTIPHHDAIQNSFGGHDVSSIEAHVGGAAAAANTAMGASAYATGNSVAFKESPSLHTAAHEAAHVIQQRGGVSLPGGVGQVGDSYEKNADAVADRVVAGQSAADLLPSGGESTPSVQQSAVQQTTPASSGSSSSSSSSSSSGSGSSSGSSTTTQNGPGGPPAEGWPEEAYVEAGGTEHRLYIETQGSTTNVMQNPSPTPVQIASSSRNSFDIVQSVKTKTAEYVAMPKDTPAQQEARRSKLAIIRREMTYLKAAMAKARGEDIDLVNLRKGFEKELGTKAWAGSGEFAVGKTELDKAILEVVNMVRISGETPSAAATTIQSAFQDLRDAPTFQTMISALGTDLTKGYAGAVGTEFEAVKAALIGGDTNAKIVHLHNFATSTFLAEVSSGTPTTRSEVYKRVEEQMDPTFWAMMKEKILAGKSDKKMIEFRETDQGYSDAKTDDVTTLPGGEQQRRGMDTKRPPQPVENLTGTSLDHLARAKGIDLSGCTTDEQKQARLITGGATVSGGGRGGDAEAFIGELETGYCQGIVDNVLRSDNQWIQDARALKMPLTSGISGTTRRVLGVCVPLSVSSQFVRLPMLGQCIQINMHSFHETMAASVGFPGCEYDPGSYIPFAPIADATMRTMAQEYCKSDATFAANVTGTLDVEHQAKHVLGEL